MLASNRIDFPPSHCFCHPFSRRCQTQLEHDVCGSKAAARLRLLTIRAFQTLAVPDDYQTELPADPMVGNVARTYARMAADLRQGTRTAPSFDDAVALHRVIAAIETAAADGKTLDIGRASA
jgi:predicted dehydrogenase